MWNPTARRRPVPGTRLRRARGLAAVTTAGVLALTACGGGGGGGNESSGGDPLAQYRDNGITIGFANEKPYDFKNAEGKVVGEAPALARAILGKLGIDKLTFKVVDFDGLIPGLQADRFAMTAGAASITPKRAKRVLYADPDYCVFEALAVKKGNPLNLSDYTSIAKNPKATLAVESGATELKYAQAVGVPKDRLKVVSNNQAMVAAVKTGRADAFSLTGNTVRSLVKTSGGGQLEALKGFNPVVDGKEKISCGGFQFRKDEQALRDAFTKQLHKLQKAGKVYETVKKASPKGDAFGFTKQQFQEAKKHTAAALGKTG